MYNDKAREVIEKNILVISLFPLDSEQCVSAVSDRKVAGHSSGERLNLHLVLLDVESTLLLGDEIKVLFCFVFLNPSFEAKEIISFPFITFQHVVRQTVSN